MADVAVENPANTVAPHKRPAPTDSVPIIDSLEGAGTDSGDEYATLKRLQRHLEYVLWVLACMTTELTLQHRYIHLQEEYIKDEQRYARVHIDATSFPDRRLTSSLLVILGV
jgi:26S proteasome regulatory subunit T3